MGIRQSVNCAIAGNRPAAAEIRVSASTARTTKDAYCGWSYRRRYTVTNNTGNAMSNYPYALDLGLTDALVTGSKALASGNDLRVTQNGVEVRRTLVNWNDATYTTLCWVILPDLGAGGSVTFEVLYGNASAGAPPTLAYPYLPAFDIATAGANRSTNAKWVYPVARTAANAAKGGWWIERGNAVPGYADTTIPGAWRPTTTLANGIDDTLQGQWTAYTDTLVYYMGRFSATRARDGSLIDAELMDADGVMIDVPAGITSVKAELEFYNDVISAAGSNPVGKLIIGGRNSDSGDWVPFYTNSTAYSSVTTIATATYTPAANMRQVCMAVWPYNGVSIPANTTTGRYAKAAWVGTLEVNIASTGIAQATAMAETACYDLSGAIRLGKDGTAYTVTKSEARLGNWSQATGAGTPRLMTALNEIVVVDGGSQTATIWNSGATAIVETVAPGCIAWVDTVVSTDRVESERTGGTGLALLPVSNPLANPDFSTDASGWTRASATSGLTAAALARTTAQYTSSPASGTVVISANTAGAGAEAVDYTDLLSLGTMLGVWVGCDVRSTSANVVLRPAVYWYDASGAYLSRTINEDYTPTANTWYRRVAGGSAPLNATQYRVALVTFARTAGATGTVFGDAVTVNANEVQWRDPDGGGTVTVTVNWRERYG